MSVVANIPRSEQGGWFVGERKVLSFHVVDKSGVPIDVIGVPMLWALRRTVGLQHYYQAQGAEVISKTSGSGISVTGTYDVDPAVNTQRVIVTVEAADTESLRYGVYAHALKRTDDAAVLSEGTVELLLSAAR